jgi:hypothetical protein
LSAAAEKSQTSSHPSSDILILRDVNISTVTSGQLDADYLISYTRFVGQNIDDFSERFL